MGNVIEYFGFAVWGLLTLYFTIKLGDYVGNNINKWAKIIERYLT